jgi:hypothetical protein
MAAVHSKSGTGGGPLSSREGTQGSSLRGGFTLVELLVATVLVMMFGAMAVATLRYGTGLWRTGHRRNHAYEAATMIFHQIENDLNAAKGQFWNTDPDAFDVRVKFYVDHDPLFDGEPTEEGGRHRLRFVRGIPDDTVNPRLRQAGDGIDNDGDATVDEEYYNLIDDLQEDLIDAGTGLPGSDGLLDAGDGRVDEDLMPLEGMCEVAYLLGLGPDDRDTLYRAVLAPIGVRSADANTDDAVRPEGWNASFFYDDLNGPTEDDYLDDPQEVQAKALPLVERVLHFEVRCWTQCTTTWEVDPDVPFEWYPPYHPQPCPPTFTWDSDRLSTGPEFVMDWGVGDYTDFDDDHDGVWNSQDEDYVLDNVFPRAVMVVVVVEPPERLRVQNPLRLAADLTAADLTGLLNVPVTGRLPAYNKRWPYIRIGNEWMRFSSFDTGASAFVLDPDPADDEETPGERGARGTELAAHSAGELVLFGYTFSRVFYCPVGRDYWQDVYRRP